MESGRVNLKQEQIKYTCWGVYTKIRGYDSLQTSANIWRDQGLFPRSPASVSFPRVSLPATFSRTRCAPRTLFLCFSCLQGRQTYYDPLQSDTESLAGYDSSAESGLGDKIWLRQRTQCALALQNALRCEFPQQKKSIFVFFHPHTAQMDFNFSLGDVVCTRLRVVFTRESIQLCSDGKMRKIKKHNKKALAWAACFHRLSWLQTNWWIKVNGHTLCRFRKNTKARKSTLHCDSIIQFQI